MQGTAYHQENLLQEDTTNHILGEFNTVKNNIIEALEDHNKENVNTPRVKVAKNASSAQNGVLLKITQYLATLNKEVQSMKNFKTITVKKKHRQKSTILGRSTLLGETGMAIKIVLDTRIRFP